MLLEFLEGAAYVATILGIPAALFVYIRDRRLQRFERYRQAYADVDTAYIEFMKLCLENADVTVLREERMEQAWPRSKGTEEDIRRKWVLYSILLSVLERAYVAFCDCPRELRDHQWSGWESYALDYLEMPEFREVWDAIGCNFDQRFFTHMENAISQRDGTRVRASTNRA